MNISYCLAILESVFKTGQLRISDFIKDTIKK